MTSSKSVIDVIRDVSKHCINFERNEKNFYGLSRIHKSYSITERCKNADSSFVDILFPDELNFRPIVAGPANETHRLSNSKTINKTCEEFHLS